MHADWIFTGGPVYSGPSWVAAEAIAIRGGRVLSIGTLERVMEHRGAGTKVYDLGGRPLIPGLVDAHLHLVNYGMTLDTLAVAGMTSLNQVQDAVAMQVAARAPGEWIIGRGWDQDRWVEKREPNRFDLDVVSPNHPVFLQRNCNHVAVVNSAALRAAGITKETPDPEGGQIDRDPVTGEPTGMLRENAQWLVKGVLPEVSVERRRTLLKQAALEALSYGITQVHTDDVDKGGDGFATTEDLYSMVRDGEIPLRVRQMIPVAQVKEAAEAGIRTGVGDEWYKYAQVKIFADGSLGGRTAALLEPYADDPGNSGIYMFPHEAFIEQVCEAHRLGNQVGSHCIGDGAAELFLDAVAEAQRRHERADSRHRLIHCQIMNEAQFDRMRELGVIGDIQPVFIRSDGYWFHERVGDERTRSSYAWKSMLDKGLALCGGSDCPIEPLNIWYGVYCAVNRQDLNGFPAGGWQPEQKLTVAEALDLYTTGAAYSVFEENEKGKLEPGYLADLVVLDRDPFTCDPQGLKDVKVHLTMVGGKVGYEA